MSPAELTTMAHSQMPFAEMLGVEIVSGEPDEVVATGVWKPEHCTAGGLVHGGYLMAVADSVGALCAFLNLSEGATTSTIESKTNFFRPVTSGTIRFAATPVHVGGRVVVVQTDASNENGKLVSRTTQTQTVIRP
ncbi:MAG TPA: PaaI family thioesterase [Acidimicrobiia bacterium]